MIALCVLFAVSALSVGFLDMGERQLNKAIFAVREDSMGGGGGGGYDQGMGEVGAGGGFRPTPRRPTGPGGMGMDGYDDDGAPPRPSMFDDRLNDRNRPVTLYNEGLTQPPEARMQPGGYRG
jgi:hypothetical protein